MSDQLDPRIDELEDRVTVSIAAAVANVDKLVEIESSYSEGIPPRWQLLIMARAQIEAARLMFDRAQRHAESRRT